MSSPAHDELPLALDIDAQSPTRRSAPLLHGSVPLCAFSMVIVNFETVEGIVVQVMSCLCAAIGLSFMKLSSLRDGDSLPIQRPLWWLGFLFLSVVATALDVVVLGILPLSMVAPFAGLTIVFSITIASFGCITDREPLTSKDVVGAALVLLGVTSVAMFGPHDAPDSLENPSSQKGRSEETMSVLADELMNGTLPSDGDLPVVYRTPVTHIIADETGALDHVIAALTNPLFSVFAITSLALVMLWVLMILVPSLGGHFRDRALARASTVETALSAYSAAVCGALCQTFLKVVSVALRITFDRCAHAGGR